MTSPSDTESLRAEREAVVREHMDAENRLDFEAALDTFAEPRYELIASGEVFVGAEQVRGYYRASRTAFPDQRNTIHSFRHADDSVIVEFDLLGTHLGPLYGVAATGKEFVCRMIALFIFDESTNIVCERIYYDSATIARQLGIQGV